VEGESDNRIATARFVVAFDGSLLLIGILDPVPEDYGRAFDARDRFIEILQKTAGFETIAPCLARSSLLLRVKGDDTISSADYVTSLVVTKNSDLKFAMKIAWLRLVELEFGFYGLCQISHREREIALVTIPSEENRLLENVKEFLSTRFFQIRKRRSISMKVRTQTTSILSLLSEHRLRTSLLSEEVAGFEERLPHNGLLKDLLMKNDWKDFVDPGVLDSESALAIVDHARSEMQAYGTISVTIWAAILGALLGSLVGFLLTLVIPRLV
jgi:hypothetical protein